MRASLVGLIALPLAASSVAAAAVAGFGLRTPTSDTDGQTGTAAVTGDATDTGTTVEKDDTGTAINGAKPYLTIIDGRSSLPVPEPIPSFLPQPAVPSKPLAPLPAQADGRADPGPDRARDGHAPPDPAAPGGATGTHDLPATFEPLSADGVDRTPASGDRGAGERPSAPTPGDGRPPVTVSGPPAHAGETGPPPHAGETGPPPHAGRSTSGDSPVRSGPPARNRAPDEPVRTAPSPTAAGPRATESTDDHPSPR